MTPPTLRHVENFTLGDVKSVNALTRNKPGEVISPTSYFKLMVDVLKENGGAIYQDQLEADIMWHFAGVWGPDDLKFHGGTKRPRWLNFLDIAKVMGRRAVPQVLNKHVDRDGEDVVMIVLDVPTTDRKLIRLVRQKAKDLKKAKFLQWCPQCKQRVKLAKNCGVCGFDFQKKSARKDKLPE